MKKTLAFMLLLFVSIFVPKLNCEAEQVTKVLNNKTLSCDKAIKDGNVVMISYMDTVSSKTKNGLEVYNIKRLDDFMDNINSQKKDKVRIIKYKNNTNGTTVSKLYDIKYDGKAITYTEYDVYSNSNAFKPLKTLSLNKISMREYEDKIWYGIHNSKSKNKNCTSFISFSISSIVDRKQ